MKIHRLPVAEALASVHSDSHGLAVAEARRRLAEFGPNRVERVEGPSLVLHFLQGFAHFFALILWVAAALCFVAYLFDPGGGMGTLAVAVVGVIVINGHFSFWQEYRAERAPFSSFSSFFSPVIQSSLLRCSTLTSSGFIPGNSTFARGCLLVPNALTESANQLRCCTLPFLDGAGAEDVRELSPYAHWFGPPVERALRRSHTRGRTNFARFHPCPPEWRAVVGPSGKKCSVEIEECYGSTRSKHAGGSLPR